MRVILTEKPSVARDIARVLRADRKGPGCLEREGLRVTWCLGHLAELAEPQRYDPAWQQWRMAGLPMLPEQFRLDPPGDGDKGRRQQWEVVRQSLLDPALAEVVNACDAGREGELIFAYAYQLAGCTAPVRRLWLGALTDEAIRRGFDQLRAGAELAALEAAARCRSEADWLVGLNATRALTLKNRERGGDALLSVGRVQTPTLAMISSREAEIEGFVSRPFWQVKVRFGAPQGEWEALWEKERQDRFEEREAAQAVLDRTAGLPGEVTAAEHKRKHERAPLLYDLTTLQREANQRFGYSAQQTLDLAQALYERHKLLTYPRTDSRHLASAQTGELPAVLQALEFGPYAAVARRVLDGWPPAWSRRLVDDDEVRDHHAIIPTPGDPQKARIDTAEKRIYDLVARRFLAAFLPDAVFATTRLVTRIGDDGFVARGRTLLEPGWQAIDPPHSTKKKKGKKEEEPAVTLPPVEVGQTAEQKSRDLHEGKTKPPPYYNEASLLGAMERAGEGLEEQELRRAMKGSGLGTPATRASIIETLLRRGFIERRGKQVHATPRGRALIDVLPVEALRSPRLTGRWEHRLAAIAEGQESRETFMGDIRRFTGEAVAQIRACEIAPIAGDAKPAPRTPPLGDCPACATPVRRRGTIYTCDSGRACPFVVFGNTSGVEVPEQAVREILTQGRSGLLRGFQTREGARFDGVLRWTGKRVEPLAVDPREAHGTAGRCPGCGGEVAFRGGRWRCAGCRFSMPAELMGRPLRPAEAALLLCCGRTPRLHGFRQQGGAFCKAALVLEPGGVRVDFARPPEDPPRPLPAGGPPPAFGEPLDCPLCLLAGRLDPGYLIAGKSAWGCSAWQKAGCPLQVPFVLCGRKMNEEEAARLLGKQRATRFLRGFQASDGLPRREACRVVLDPRAEHGWRLEEQGS